MRQLLCPEPALRQWAKQAELVPRLMHELDDGHVVAHSGEQYEPGKTSEGGAVRHAPEPPVESAVPAALRHDVSAEQVAPTVPAGGLPEW